MSPIPLNSWRVIYHYDDVAILKPGHAVPFNWSVHTHHATEADAVASGHDYLDSLDMLASI